MRKHMLGTISSAATRVLIGTLVLITVVSVSAGVSRAAQFIPAVGYSKATDSSAGDGQAFGSAALRASLLPFLSVEGGIAYRQDSFLSDQLTVRQWPVTASLWLNPGSVLYAGGGLGWYRTTYDYRSTLPFTDTTTDKVGVHLGGGLAMPLTPHVGLDLNGRYVFMQKDDKIQLPTEFNPDFWSTSLGLAIKF